MRQFGPFRTHDAVARARDLHDARDVGFSTVASRSRSARRPRWSRAWSRTTIAPGLREIVVYFDRPVRDHRYGVVPLFVGGRPTLPDVPPPPVTGHALDTAGTTLRIALAPGREYAFQLNTPNGYGFCSLDGASLAPYPIRFRTQNEQWRSTRTVWRRVGATAVRES